MAGRGVKTKMTTWCLILNYYFYTRFHDILRLVTTVKNILTFRQFPMIKASYHRKLLTDSGGICCMFSVQLPSPFPGTLMVTDRQPSITLQSPSMNQQRHDYMLHFIFTSSVLCCCVRFRVVIYRPIRVQQSASPSV